MLYDGTIAHEELLFLLNYDPKEGVFTWRWDLGVNKAGDVAGWEMNLGYRHIVLARKIYAEHRLAWFYVNREWPSGEIDHINQNRKDNRISNLRNVTRQENQQNRSIGKNNTSGIIGVSWYKRDNKWRATIKVDGVYVGLGCFKTKEEARAARKSAEKKYGFHENHGKSIRSSK